MLFRTQYHFQHIIQMLQLILITFLFCANNKGQPVAAPEVLGADQDPRGQGSGQVGGDVSQASNI